MRFFEKILKWIYPETFVFCGKVCRQGICESCRKEVFYVGEPCCKKCGKPIRYEEQEYCHDCQGREVSFEQGRSIWLHKGLVKQSVYQFKYHNKRAYSKVYAREMSRLYGALLQKWNPDVLIPVPLHRKRRRVRGYNQADVLAKEIGRSLNLPVAYNIVKRHRYTNPQKELNKRQRNHNLKDAFCVKNLPEEVKKVVIIDDIYTTGSTIDAIAEKLKEKGVQKVWFLTISIGQGF